jgi:hypothetical protein
MPLEIDEVPSEQKPAENAQALVAEPEKTEVPAEPIKPVEAKVVPEDKYQASVKAMNEAQREAALARKEIELLKREKANPKQVENVQPTQKVYTEEEKAKLCDYYGVSDFRQIQLQLDAAQLMAGSGIQSLKKDLDELSGTIYEDKYQSTKDKLKSSDIVFKEFEPEIEERLNRLTPRERIKRENIEAIRKDVIAENFERILELTKQQAKDEALREVNPQPPSIPSVNSVSGGGASRTQKTTLTKEQRAITERFGLDVNDVEKVVSGQIAPSSWAKHLA